MTFNLETIWSIEHAAFTRLADELRLGHARPERSELGARVRAAGGAVPQTIAPSVAFLDVVGGLWKSDYLALQSELQQILQSPAVTTVVILIDSPGGTVSGLAETADLLATVRASGRHVIAQVVGMAASAAYRLAVEADAIFAGRQDLVGSIGTVQVLYDWSQYLTDQGVKTVAITTGEHKAIGVTGVPITDANKAYVQGVVDTYFADFRDAVASRRKITSEQIEQIADGRVFVGQQAVDLGLVDGLQTLDATLLSLSTRSRPMTESKQEKAPEAPVAATVQQLEQLSQSAPTGFNRDAFSLGCLKQSATLEAATRQYADAIGQFASAQAEAHKKELDQARQQATIAATATPLRAADGVPDTRPGASAPAAGDAIEQWNAAVKAHVDAGMLRQSAARRVAQDHPDLHKRYLEQYTAKHGNRSERMA